MVISFLLYDMYSKTIEISCWKCNRLLLLVPHTAVCVTRPSYLQFKPTEGAQDSYTAVCLLYIKTPTFLGNHFIENKLDLTNENLDLQTSLLENKFPNKNQFRHVGVHVHLKQLLLAPIYLPFSIICVQFAANKTDSYMFREYNRAYFISVLIW